VNRFVKYLIYLVCVFGICANPSTEAAARQQQVLFVCTGNYYRSRFAEALFNQKARAAHLEWHATSRGLNLAPWQFGVSRYARDELIKRGVPVQLWSGAPKKLTKSDIAQSDYIILMDETEHRQPFEKKFPQSSGAKLQYWHIPDSGQMKPAQACAKMATRIDDLLKTLQSDTK
jgi:protein-tyrosine phosphatase